MKILVTYYSKTGNTEKVAKAISGAFQGEDVDLEPLGEGMDVGGYNLVLCGFPVHAHSVPVKIHNFLKRLPDGANLALFSTHGALPEGPMAGEALSSALGTAKHARVLGSFTCRGQVEEKVLEELEERPEHRAWVAEARSAEGHPDEADCEDAVTFARGCLKRVLKFKD